MELRIHKTGIGGSNPPRILGVLNVSPESFFSDSFTPCSQVRRRAEELRRQGADIIDLGGRSTALSSPPISVAEEKERVVAALKELAGDDLLLSLDTCRPEVLEAALHYDIAVANDISGLLNPAYAKLAADAGLPVIAMAAHTAPGDATTMMSTHAAIQAVLKRADIYEIESLILDPGIGKWVAGRSNDADWELCRRFAELKQYGYPLLAAVSRKLFIGECVGKPAQDRLFGSLAVAYHLMEEGADLLRVHDVAATRDLIMVFERFKEKI